MNKRQAKKLSKQRALARAERSRSYASEYYRTGAEVQSAVNRINSRIRTAYEHFGEESKTVQDLYTKLDLLIPQENLRYNVNGVLQIARPYELFKNEDVHKIIYSFDTHDIKTYGELKAEYQKGYESFKKSNYFFDSESRNEITMDQYIDIFSSLYDALVWASEHKDTPEGMEILNIAHQKKKTYNDLLMIFRLYKEGATKYDD